MTQMPSMALWVTGVPVKTTGGEAKRGISVTITLGVIHRSSKGDSSRKTTGGTRSICERAGVCKLLPISRQHDEPSLLTPLLSQSSQQRVFSTSFLQSPNAEDKTRLSRRQKRADATCAGISTPRQKSKMTDSSRRIGRRMGFELEAVKGKEDEGR